MGGKCHGVCENRTTRQAWCVTDLLNWAMFSNNQNYTIKGEDFRRVGLSTLTDILNAVAPPISEHEVIQVWLSHDMEGYEGVESLAYRALARVCISYSESYICLIFLRFSNKSRGEI